MAHLTPSSGRTGVLSPDETDAPDGDATYIAGFLDEGYDEDVWEGPLLPASEMAGGGEQQQGGGSSIMPNGGGAGGPPGGPSISVHGGPSGLLDPP